MGREPDPDFADTQDSSSFSNLSDADSFGGEDSEPEVAPVRVPTTSTKSEQLSLSLDQSASQHGPSYNSMLAWNKRSDSAGVGDDDDDDEEEDDEEPSSDADLSVTKKQARSREPPTGSKEKIRSSSAERSLVRRSNSSSSTRSMTKSSSSRKLNTKDSGDELSSSMHKGVTDRRIKRRDGTGGASELASTVHGDEIPGYSRAPSRRPNRGAPSRAKSGDGAPPPSSRRSSKDELGAATLHGKSSVSRIRSKGRSTLDEGKTKEKEKSKPDRRSMMKRAMSTTNVKRPEEYGPDGNGASTNGLPFESPTPRRAGRRPQRPPRRQLLDLLRENKPVTEKDLADKENRQLLHRLVYEHKLGVSLKDLAKKVKKETKNGVVPPPPKPLLYVEA
ncbi:hypothetical protein FisN_7Hh116 [Fistulifera solaris]|uniref:Uncharacterized protein n=1 Tax=Fistulifera solaris TaxID=1519565 RepID=A0A1Z5K3I0_FISSO|nr:hypothetical protein FisN_7Hh116 [Fistulifera solaris]|eukprot:GAX20803.1 hypothetical protein FisN_7Hh116 [Fistulifera solaris]